MPAIRRLTKTDVPRLRQFWLDRWCGDVMIVHGQAFRPELLEGFIVEEGNDWLGLVTFYVQDNECEIVSLDSLCEGRGLGSSLIEQVILEARRKFWQRIFLSTTNDNLRALGFYQKRGFELVGIRRGTLDETRKLKPGIPLIASNGIPIRDEIELELSLNTS
ncbi:MAG: GNAT family N-acetyltransferase [Anaerolineales bacterium]